MSKKLIEQVLTVSDLVALDVKVVAGFCAANIKASQSTYLNVAKSFIAMRDRATPDEIKALIISTDEVKAEKYASARKNAQQAIDVWDAVVAPGHADEAWFNTLTYHEFVLVNRACKAVTAKALADEGIFKMRIVVAWGKLELAVETGLTAAQREAKQAETVAAKLKPAATDPLDPAVNAAAEQAMAPKTTEATPDVPAPSIVQAPSPAPSTPATPATPTPIVEVTVTPTAAEAKKAAPMSAETAALDKIKAAETAILGLIAVATDEVSVGRVMERLAAMTLAVGAARDKRFPAVDVQSLRSLEQHVTAA